MNALFFSVIFSRRCRTRGTLPCRQGQAQQGKSRLSSCISSVLRKSPCGKEITPMLEVAICFTGTELYPLKV